MLIKENNHEYTYQIRKLLLENAILSALHLTVEIHSLQPKKFKWLIMSFTASLMLRAVLYQIR